MAVVGAGEFGRRHMRVVRECGRAELVAAVDQNAERAAQAAAEFGCRAFTSAGELAGQVDAAIVWPCPPSRTPIRAVG